MVIDPVQNFELFSSLHPKSNPHFMRLHSTDSMSTTVPKKDSRQDRYCLETHISYAPRSPTPHEEDAGSTSDLFACPDTGEFFTVSNAEIEIGPDRSMGSSSKTFQCPVCVTSSLTIRPSTEREKGEALAVCKVCGWDTSHCQVSDIGDLLQRVSMPYPWLDSHFRALVKAHNSNTQSNWNGNTSTGVNTGGLNGCGSTNNHSRNGTISLSSMSSATSSASSSSSSRRRRLTATVLRPLGDGIGFTEKQEAHERKVFAQYLPPSMLSSTTSTSTSTASLTAKYKSMIRDNIENMCKDLRESELMAPTERTANGVCFRRQAGPLQRIRTPHVTLRNRANGTAATTRWDLAVYDGSDPEYTAAYILPRIMINLKSGSATHSSGALQLSSSTASSSSSSSCSTSTTATTTTNTNTSTAKECNGQTVDLLLSLKNERQLAVTVQVENMADRSQAGELKIAAGELCMTKMKGVKWTDVDVEKCPWLDGLSSKVIQLELKVRYHMKRSSSTRGQSVLDKWNRLCKQTWGVCLFVRPKSHTT